ncbi:MAG TPA: type IV pilin protein [Steroidobacteraceae bacterium]|jgi:type IV pilus assembly protein PilE|nr:type IV pilin protein [Steroidobacteraceae bacterium]
MQTSRGFTLIELIVAMVVVTILVSIAVPSYQAQMRKSRRTEAQTTALDAASREERYYATQNTYTADTGQLGYTSGSGSFPVTTGTYYQISSITVTAPTASATGVTTGTFTVTVQALATGPQVNDTACQTFVVTQTGARTATGTDSTPNTTCWQ